MKFKMAVLRILLLVVMSSYHLAYADKLSDRVEAKISVVSLFPVEGGVLYLRSAAEEGDEANDNPYFMVRVANFRMQSPSHYKGRRKLEVFDKPNGKLLGKALLETTKGDHVLVIYPNRSEGGLFFVVNVFNENKLDFPAGARRIFNLTSYPVRGEWGRIPFKVGDSENRTFVVGGMQSQIVKPPNGSAVSQESQPLLMDYKEGMKWTNFISSRWFYEPRKRRYVFLYTTKKRKAVVIKSISERVSE